MGQANAVRVAPRLGSLDLLLMIGLPAFGLHAAVAWIASHTSLVGAGVIIAVSVVARTRATRSARSMPITGAEGMVGEVGDVVSPLQLAGTVFVRGEYWDAIARSSLPAGARIRVLRVIGMRLHVENVDTTWGAGRVGCRLAAPLPR